MKHNHILTVALLAGAAAAFVAPSARAQGTVTYTAGDLLLGFEEPGNSYNYVLDLGPVTYFKTLAATPGTTDLNTTLGITNTGIATDLSNTYGSSWATTEALGSNVQWGAFAASSTLFGGTTGAGGTLGLPKDTIFLTQAETTPGTQSTAPAEGSTSGQNGEISAFNGFATEGFNNKSATANSSVAAVIPTTSPSWSSNNPSFNAFGSGLDIEQPQGAGNTYIGPANSELDLYELLPTGAVGNTGSGVDLGSFTLDSSGDLDFTSAAAVPEPSTYAAIGLGAAFLLLFRRIRKPLRA